MSLKLKPSIISYKVLSIAGVKKNLDDWFSLSALMGGDNFYWQGTPLMCLYTKHEENGSGNPVNRAGIDAGWLLKSVIVNDSRHFETKKEFSKRIYRWCGEECI